MGELDWGGIYVTELQIWSISHFQYYLLVLYTL